MYLNNWRHILMSRKILLDIFRSLRLRVSLKISKFLKHHQSESDRQGVALPKQTNRKWWNSVSIATKTFRIARCPDLLSNLAECAQIVPVKVKYFQTVPNETKNTMKNWNRINCLYSQHFCIFKILVWKAPCRQFDSVPRHQ